MKLTKYLLVPSLVLALGMGLSSCKDDEFTPTIFPDVSDDANPESITYQFDTWLNQNFRDVYNMEFVYRMRDVESDLDYNLVPATLENSMRIAVLVKYIWYDAYAEAYGGSAETPDPGFLRAVGPKMIHLIGSPEVNTNGTITNGYASGGVQITLCNINSADFYNISSLNNSYFHTMHHEYCHILHQTKNYPNEFNLLSNGRYDSSNWQDRSGGVCLSLGFQTRYASSSYTEDFAETVSGYITRNDEDWEMLWWCAERGWYTGESDTDLKNAYSYYYYKNDEDRNNDKKTSTLLYFADSYDTNIRLLDAENKEYRTVAQVENYLTKLDENLRKKYKDNQAQERYGKKYAQLEGAEKDAIDALADAMTFVYPYEDLDKADGKAIILQKINIARNWFRDSWGMDLDNLRAIVQRRSANYNLDNLLQDIYNIPVPGKE